MDFIITDDIKEILATNITDTALLSEILKCENEIEYLKCPISNKQKRQGVKKLNNYYLYLANYDTDI